MPYDDDYDWDDDGRSYDYDDWDSHYDYDEYDSDEDVDVTLSFNIDYELDKIMDNFPTPNDYSILYNNILKYIDKCCEEINFGKKIRIVYRKGELLIFKSYLPWNVLWRNRDCQTCEEAEEKIAELFEEYFIKNVYIPTGHSLSHVGEFEIESFSDTHNIRIHKGKVNVASILSILYDEILSGEVETECDNDADLEEIAREGIDDWHDYDRSRNEAADAYFHG